MAFPPLQADCKPSISMNIIIYPDYARLSIHFLGHQMNKFTLPVSARSRYIATPLLDTIYQLFALMPIRSLDIAQRQFHPLSERTLSVPAETRRSSSS